MKVGTLDRMKGCLYGGAIGDAFGYAVEFMSIAQIREQYGPNGITELQLVNGKALISDDTQMTLFTANGILNGMTEERLHNDRRPMERYLHNAYMDWLQTQRFVPGKALKTTTWLCNIRGLHSVRAPGGTCLRSLSSGVMGTMEYPINSSKGCGGLMRVSPIGLYFNPAKYSQAEIDLLGAQSAALTHGHQLGFLPAAALVHLINRIVYSEGAAPDTLYPLVSETIQSVSSQFSSFSKIEDLTSILYKAMELSKDSSHDDLTNISALGEGWVAEEALAISLYCALRYPGDFMSALIASVNHSGDSDSTGAITASILGSLLGYNSIPTTLIDSVEFFDVLREISEDLYRDSIAPDGAHCREERWQHKYVKADFRL